MTTLTEQRPVTDDLEALFGQDLGPQYVAVFTDHRTSPDFRDRIADAGVWELQTGGEYHPGSPARDDWTLDAPADVPASHLAAWAEDLLRFPVLLDQDTAPPRALAAQSGSQPETPLYWIRRNS